MKNKRRSEIFNFQLENEFNKGNSYDLVEHQTDEDSADCGKCDVDVVTYLLLACKYQILPQSGEARNKVRYKILRVWVRRDPGVMPGSQEVL